MNMHTDDTAPAHTRPRSKPLWFAVVLVVLFVPLLWTIVSSSCETLHEPAIADFEGAANLLQQQYKVGDAVAVVPAWAQRSMQYLGDYNPLFDPQLEQRLPSASRLWLVAEPEGEATLQALARRFAPEIDQKFGRVHVVLLPLGQQLQVFDAAQHISEAHVEIVKPDKSSVACDSAKENRWDCPGRPDWQRVSAEWLDIDFTPRYALWSHPPPNNEKLVLHYPRVSFGPALELLAGHTVHGATSANGVVSVVLSIDGVEIGRLERKPAYPLTAKRFDTTAYAGKIGSLDIEIFTPDNGANHFAFNVLVAP